MTPLEILSVLFTVAAVFGLISSRWLKLPTTIGSMLLTVLVSAGLTLLSGIAPGIHHWAVALAQQINFESLILHGMLPLLLFAGAFLLDLEHLAREKFSVTVLSVAGTTLCFYLVAAALAFFSRGAIPWMQCLLFGALISPTDPIAVLEMLRRTGVPKRIQAQLAGESLFNDGIGAVLFLTMLEVARGNAPTAFQVGMLLIVKAGGGVVLGIAAAWIASTLMRRISAYQVDILFTVALALGGYVLAELLHLSAPLEAVVAGIALRHFNERADRTHIAHEDVDQFWEVIDEIQNSVLFVLLGLEALAIPLDAASVRTGLGAIVAVNAVRFAVVALLLVCVRWLQRGHKSSVFVLTWGGLRGGLSIALALSVPNPFGHAWIVGATYLVVVFSVVVQGGTMDLMLRSRRARLAAD